MRHLGRLLGGKNDPAMAGFFDNLDRINAAAERMPGFVWRLKDESGNATDIPWVGDPTMAVAFAPNGEKMFVGYSTHFYEWDLPAVRRELRAIGLDWDDAL